MRDSPEIAVRPRRNVICVAGVMGYALLLGACLAAGPEPRFEGNNSISTRQLLVEIDEQLRRFEEGEYHEVEINDAAYFIAESYRQHGYPFVKVGYQIDYDVRPPLVVFHIEEGPLVRLGGVELSGVEAFPLADITDMLMPRTPLGKDPLFEEARIDKTTKAIITKYRQAGYLDAEILEKDVELDREEGRAVLNISLKEGIQYKIARVELEGEVLYPEEEVFQQTDSFLGRPFALRQGVLASSAVRLFYMNHGHRGCEVGWDYAANPGSGEVTLTLDIDPGSRSTIRQVIIEGNARTRAAFIRNRVALRPGDTYSYEAESATYMELIRTGLFDRVNLEFQPAGEDQTDLTVKVSETKARGVELSLGYGSYEGMRGGLGLQDINVAGSGKQVRVQLGISQVGYETELSLREPSLMGSRWQGQFRLFELRRDEPSFTRREYGADVSVSRPFRRRWRHFLGYELSRSVATDIEAGVAPADERLNMAQLFAGVTYDSRDSALSPTRGTLCSLRTDYGATIVGSEVEFLRFNQQFKRFWDLKGESVVGVGITWGAIFPTGTTDRIPIQERFFLGGASSIRSFQEGELGPKDPDGTPLGGEAFTSATAELRFPMLRNLYGALFADAGSVTEEADRLGTGRYSFALGAGLRYYLPIGPIRLDYGWNPDPGKDEDGDALHLSVGFSF